MRDTQLGLNSAAIQRQIQALTGQLLTLTTSKASWASISGPMFTELERNALVALQGTDSLSRCAHQDRLLRGFVLLGRTAPVQIRHHPPAGWSPPRCSGSIPPIPGSSVPAVSAPQPLRNGV